MTIYDNLLTMGYIDEEIRAATNVHPETRAFTVTLYDSADGPIVGLSYMNDYRAEEEWGVDSLTKAITGEDRWHPFILKGKEAHFAQFTNVYGASLVLSERPMNKPLVWGEPIFRLSDVDERSPLLRADYAAWWENAVSHTQGLPDARLLVYKSMVALRELAAEVGIEKPAKTKAPLVAQIVAASVPKAPNRWPGYFHTGKVMVLRADTGIVADVLNLLHVAAMERTLGFGAGGFGPFGSGMTLYDGADIGPLYHRELWEHMKFVKKHERKLVPVRKKLEAAGWRFYFLGNPTTLDTGDGQMVVRYWMNSASDGPAGGKQVTGWFTLAQLKKGGF